MPYSACDSRSGGFGEAQNLLDNANKAARESEPDRQKMTALADRIHEFAYHADKNGIPHELKYRTVLFCITLETLARLHAGDSDPVNANVKPWTMFEALKDQDLSD